MAKKYYAVKAGNTPGIYYSWDDCRKQVEGYTGAVYKGFDNITEADEFIRGAVSSDKMSPTMTKEAVKTAADTTSQTLNNTDDNDTVIAYVDGSYEHSIRRYAYGCVILYKGECAELNGSGNDPSLVDMRNVAGEILASSYAVKWAIEHGAKSINIFHDYEGIAKWALGQWKANKEGTMKYRDYMKHCMSKINVSFTKVAAHTGVELNERADQLAKAALEKE